MYNNEETENLQHHLFNRECEFYPYGNSRPMVRLHEHYQRSLYRSIVPTASVLNVDKPLVYLRNFTPNGKLLIGISYDQSCLEIFQYNGVGVAINLLSEHNGELIKSSDTSCTSLTIRQQIFDCLLKKLHSVRLVQYDASRKPARIHREFSIFLQDGEFVLLATCRDITVQEPFNYNRLMQYPDVWIETERANYTFFVVQLNNGIVTHSIHYADDSIKLANNHNVSVWETTVAILSNTRQCIDLYEFESTGKLNFLRTVGLLESYIQTEQLNSPEIFIPFSLLKQKILSYLYKKIMNINSMQIRKDELKKFYKVFIHIERMLMMKMQLLDSEHVLMRYVHRPNQAAEKYYSEETICIIGNLFPLFVVYHITQGTVLKIFGKNSPELLRIQRDFIDDLRNVRSLQTQRAPSSPSNNYIYRFIFDSVNSGSSEDDLEDLPQFSFTMPITLPVSPQNFSISPYLDYALFYYDESNVSAHQRPVLFPENPVLFYDADNRKVKFRLHLETTTFSEIFGSNRMASPQEVVVYVFHPYDPLIISLQRLRTRYVTNFHLYNGLAEEY